MPAKFQLAHPVGFQNRLIHFGGFGFQPGNECRAKIKTHLSVVVYQLEDSFLIVKNPRRRVRPIAFRGDAFVPVVIWIGGIL